METIVNGKHLKHLYFELLEYLSDYGIGIEANIKDLCGQYAIKELKHECVGDALEAFSKRWSEIIAVLESIKKLGYIKYSTEHGDLGRLYIMGGNFSVSITKEGLDYYYTHILRKATLKSLKNQKWSNRITWGISLLAIFISTGASIFLGLKNSSLDTRVLELERAQKPPTYKTKEAKYLPKHIDIPLKNGG